MDGFSPWRKPRRSFSNGNCAEVASWRKSTHSGYNGSCVEAGHGPGTVGVRDSKLGDASPVLEFSGEQWACFTAALKGSAHMPRIAGPVLP